jgi:uncharacterized protein (TIGR00290 family)
MSRVVVSWSGGKESTFACYRAISMGNEVLFLLNMALADGKRSMSHGIRSELLIAQSEAIGIPLIQRKTTWNNYEKDFKEEILHLKKFGIKGIVFGDIDIQEHRDWDERICNELKVEPILPLWGQERGLLLENFIKMGFKAVIVTVNAKLLDQNLLNRCVDNQLIKDLSKIQNIDLCGERGEYHTFVFDGPSFKKQIKLIESEKILKEGYWFLDIIKYNLINKTN